MYICTCLNCGKFYEDNNPAKDSINYPDDVFLPCLEVGEDADEQGISHHCPICKTDGYLVDNASPISSDTQKGIYYADACHPIRTIIIEGVMYNIGFEALNDMLWKDENHTEPKDDEAENIDNDIYFYAPNIMLLSSTTALTRYVKAATA